MDAQVAFEASVHADLGVLVAGGQHRCEAPGVATRWRLPEGDVTALRRWGVPVFRPAGAPDDVQLRGDVQLGPFPEVDDQDVVGYRLGRYWRHTIVAVEGSGLVAGLPDDPTLGVSRIDTTVAAFLEISWRWYHAHRALRTMTGDEERLSANLATFQDLVHRIDPAVRDDPAFGWWNGVVEGW